MATAELLSPPETSELLPDLYEIVNGEIREKEMSLLSSGIATVIVENLGPYVRKHGLGRAFCEALFRIDRVSNLKRRPDVAFVSSKQLPADRAIPNTDGPDIVPELMVEVVSPSNTHNDVQNKLDEYFRAGVQRVWVVMPEQQRLAIYESPTRNRILSRTDTLEDPDLFPGFQSPLSELFLASAPK